MAYGLVQAYTFQKIQFAVLVILHIHVAYTKYITLYLIRTLAFGP